MGEGEAASAGVWGDALSVEPAPQSDDADTPETPETETRAVTMAKKSTSKMGGKMGGKWGGKKGC